MVGATNTAGVPTPRVSSWTDAIGIVMGGILENERRSDLRKSQEAKNKQEILLKQVEKSSNPPGTEPSLANALVLQAKQQSTLIMVALGLAGVLVVSRMMKG